MINITRTFDILSYNEKHQPLKKALSIKRNNRWNSFSTQEYRSKVNLLSFALMELGFKKGDKVATVINNSPEWNFLDFGMSQLGVVHVGIYPTIGAQEYAHILSHSEARILVLSSKELYEKIAPVAKKIDTIKGIYSIEKIEGVKNLDDLFDLGEKNAEKHKKKLAEKRDAVKPDDLLTLIYTSGTTGLSKGVMLTHQNVVSNVLLGWEFVGYLNYKDRAFSFLPMSHVLERTGNYLWQSKGLEIHYAESIDTLSVDMKDVKPHVFIAVPRIFEKVYDKIINTGRELSFVKKNIFFWAVKLADNFKENPEMLSWVYKKQIKLADKLIFSKWREALGGHIKGVISGGAALQPRLARAFWAANIRLQEGYGLTETSPIVTANGYEFPKVRFGSVGYINKGVSVRIADDGEILIRGENVMKGYYKDAVKTNEVLKDGWFHSGDIGKIEDNFLFITDRKKEIFKLSGGKYVAPQVVENVLKESNFIEQAMVIGENERFTAALIAPDFVFLNKWAELHSVVAKDNKELINHQKVIDRIKKEVDAYNEQLNQTSKIKEFRLVCESWSPESGDLSPTLKLKRRSLLAKYKTKIEEIYHTK